MAFTYRIRVPVDTRGTYIHTGQSYKTKLKLSKKVTTVHFNHYNGYLQLANNKKIYIPTHCIYETHARTQTEKDKTTYILFTWIVSVSKHYYCFKYIFNDIRIEFDQFKYTKIAKKNYFLFPILFSIYFFHVCIQNIFILLLLYKI